MDAPTLSGSPSRAYLASLRSAQIFAFGTSQTRRALYAKHLKQEIHKIKQIPNQRLRDASEFIPMVVEVGALYVLRMDEK
jgi:hypothetical protein